MLLIYTPKITPRLTYVFKHVCIRILGLDIGFTTTIEEFISHSGAKLSYSKQPLGNEFFIQSRDLLFQQGVESIDIAVRDWEDTVCFFKTGEKSELPYDIFAAAFYLISRYEEYLPHVKDELGRYPVTESLAFKNNFLKQPVVDIWAYKFKQKLARRFPDLKFSNRRFKTEHLIKAETPFLFKYKGAFRTSISFGSDFFTLKWKTLFKRLKTLLGFTKDPYEVYDFIINITKKEKQNTVMFFILGETEDFFKDIETQHPKYKELIKHVGDYLSIGLLFSQKALQNFTLLKSEKQRMETITNRVVKQSVNHRFVVNLPDFYRNLIALEIKTDCSMVYASQPGFRAGTCTPFLFYDLDFEIKTPLLIQPIAFTTSSFYGKTTSEIKKESETVLAHIKEVNGTLSIIFNHSDFSENTKNNYWEQLYINP